MTTPRTRVLIVDDSAFARKVIREVLEKDLSIEVIGYARDGLDALEKIMELKPDVVTLDLVMPDLDGLGVLRTLSKISSTRVIVVSSSGMDSELVLEALHLGAIDVVTKPTALATDRLYELRDDLLEKVKAAAIANPVAERASAVVPNEIKKIDYNGETKLVVLGTSTGGPQAISEIFKSLPNSFPAPLVIALHIPHGYTAALAARVSKVSQLKLIEAYDGLELVANLAVIAPGGMHLTIKNIDGKLFAAVSRAPEETLYHPSIDLLFKSAAEQVNGKVLGVVLTGMGSDGMLGSVAIRKAGGRVLAESASTCVVYGMPRSVIEADAANAEAPLDQMVKLIIDYL